MPQYTVQPEHVAQAVATRTGIPAGEVQNQERQRLEQLEQLLRERIVGQDQAVLRSPGPCAGAGQGWPVTTGPWRRSC